MGAQPQAVLTGSEAIARVEGTLARNALARDPAVAEGLALAGVRAASLSRGVALGPADGIALPGVSCVHHVEQAPGQARGGAFEFAATSAQQASDQCLAAHLLSRRLGRAGVCSLAPSLAQALSLVRLPGPELVADLLAADPGPQELEADPDRILELASEALRSVGERTGRTADLIDLQGDEGAEVVLVAAGAEAAPAQEAARALSDAGLSAAALSVIGMRPFPETRVRRAVAGARIVLVVHDPGEPSALLAAVRAAAGDKANLHPLPATTPAQVIQALSKILPDSAFDPPRLASAVEQTLSRQLVVAPAGPWGEQTAREALAALAHLGSLRMERRSPQQLGTTLLAWGSAALAAEAQDLLLASHPALLEAQGGLELLRPGSALVVLSPVDTPQALVRLLSPATRALLRERSIRVHWVADPGTGEGEPAGALSRAASLALAGAALALLGGSKAGAAAAATGAGRDPTTRWLRAGLEGIHALDPAELEAPPPVEEVDFRPAAKKLPRMPAAVEDAQLQQRWGRWIRRFHRTGVGPLDPAPRLPVRPALLDPLAEGLRATFPHPLVLAPAEDAAQPIAARGLRELLHAEVESLQVPASRALVDNLDALAAIAARRLREQESGAEPLHDLLSHAGKKLRHDLALPGGEEKELAAGLAELRRRLPRAGRVLDLRPDTPVRLYLAVREAARGPLRRRFVAQLEELRERLRDLLKLDRMGSADGRAPEALAAELGGTGANYVDPSVLARTLPESASSARLDEGRRHRIQQSLATIERHLEEQERLAQVLFLRPPGLELPLSAHEQQEHPDPLAAAVGYFDGTARRMAPLFRAVRVARLEVVGAYEPERHDEFLANLDWEALTADELALLPSVVVVTTGRRLRQRGQGSLSALLSSSRPVHVIVLDEVGAPDQAEDLSAFHIDLGYLVMAHREAFALSSTLARPDRLTQGLLPLIRAPRPGVVLVHLPSPELAPWHALLAEAALQGRACPEFLYDPDAGASWADRFDLSGNPQPECAWPTHRIAYLENGAEQSLEASFTFADAVALEPAYLRHLRVIPRAAWDDAQLPLAEYLERFDPEGRERSIPYLWVVDDAGELQRAVLTRELAVACRDRLRGWRVLQELAGYENVYAQRAAAAAREQALAEAATQRAELEQGHAEALDQARSEGARESMARLAAVLMNPEGLAAASLPDLLAAPTPAAAPLAAEPAVEASAEPVPAPEAPEEEEEALSFDEPYIDAPLCTTCNECTNLNPRLFQYNADKQAFIADPAAGTFAELVKAAELCPARCIHPGKPRSGDATATPELIQRAAPFN